MATFAKVLPKAIGKVVVGECGHFGFTLFTYHFIRIRIDHILVCTGVKHAAHLGEYIVNKRCQITTNYNAMVSRTLLFDGRGRISEIGERVCRGFE